MRQNGAFSQSKLRFFVVFGTRFHHKRVFILTTPHILINPMGLFLSIGNVSRATELPVKSYKRSKIVLLSYLPI